MARQREDALELATRRAWQIVAEYDDNDVSASGKRARPGFDAMLAAIDAGAIDAVVAWSLDRLTRNRRDTVRLIEACQRSSVTIALVRGSDLDMSTPSGRLVADVLASVARSEIEIKSDRQRRANLQRARAGKPHAGRRAFGYTSTGDSVVESEAGLIRRGYSLLLAGGSLRSVVRDWNGSGITSTAGGAWRPDSVRGILMNPRYAAIRVYQGEQIGRGDWPPIVSEETLRAARSLLTDPSRSTVKDRSVKFLLTSIAECGRCDDGALMATARTQHGVRTYKCHDKGDVSRKAEPIDQLVEALVIARLSRPDAAALLQVSSHVDVAELRTEADARRQALEEAASLFASGAIRASQLATITATIERELADLERAIGDAGRGDALADIVGADDVRAAWSALDIARQRAIVKALFARIVVGPVKRGARIFEPDSVRIEWRRQ